MDSYIHHYRVHAVPTTASHMNSMTAPANQTAHFLTQYSPTVQSWIDGSDILAHIPNGNLTLMYANDDDFNLAEEEARSGDPRYLVKIANAANTANGVLPQVHATHNLVEKDLKARNSETHALLQFLQERYEEEQELLRRITQRKEAVDISMKRHNELVAVIKNPRTSED